MEKISKPHWITWGCLNASVRLNIRGFFFKTGSYMNRTEELCWEHKRTECWWINWCLRHIGSISATEWQTGGIWCIKECIIHNVFSDVYTSLHLIAILLYPYKGITTAENYLLPWLSYLILINCSLFKRKKWGLLIKQKHRVLILFRPTQTCNICSQYFFFNFVQITWFSPNKCTRNILILNVECILLILHLKPSYVLFKGLQADLGMTTLEQL